MNKSRLIVFVFCCLLSFLPYTTYANSVDTQLIFYNDVPVTLNSPIISLNGDFYINLREASSLLDISVNYDTTTHTAIASSEKHTFSYNLKTHDTTFDGQPLLIDSSPFIFNNATYIPAQAFGQLFEFDAHFSYDLFIVEPTGQETIYLDYIDEPLVIDTYDYIPVTTLLINDIPPSIHYTQSTYTAIVTGYFIEDHTLFLSLNPYSEVAYPEDYSTISDLILLNPSSTTINLPLSPELSYTYLTYTDSTFSTDTTTNPSILLKHLQEDQLYLVEVVADHGTILSVSQIYTP